MLLSQVIGNVHENLAETKQREVKQNEEFEKSSLGHTIFTVLEVFMIVLLLVLVFLFIVRLLYKDSLNKVKIPCYLCSNHFEKLDQKHRDMCAGINNDELELIPSPRKVWCCFCSEKLKLWPAYKMTPFRCNSGFENCPLKEKKTRCDGTNRFSCFLCDYTLCIGCVDTIDPVAKNGTEDEHQTCQNSLQRSPYSQQEVSPIFSPYSPQMPEEKNLINVYNSPWNALTSDYVYLV
eukprot:TRINITY_DN37640_c0_g1_i1.p1 TRINITY_DN37640_c0_g1~~TRINITY_DN37640_c0_g1_i1.p1  ORF type:complete len:235 (+),score=44.33 TRINITY_DN37640_c0_g1_i1:1-705(+)